MSYLVYCCFRIVIHIWLDLNHILVYNLSPYHYHRYHLLQLYCQYQGETLIHCIHLKQFNPEFFFKFQGHPLSGIFNLNRTLLFFVLYWFQKAL